MSLNIRSANANIKKLLDHITGMLEQPLIIALQEIWSTDKADRLVDSQHYKITTQCRVKGRGGGVGFLIKRGVQYDVVEECTFSRAGIGEAQTIWIKWGESSYYIINIYRKPLNNKTAHKDFLTMLNSLIKKVRKDSKNIEDIIVLGDFNIDLNQLSKDTHVNNFLGKLTELGLSLCVTHPTRVVSVVLQDGSMKHTNTLIDNVLATKLYNTVHLPWSISDHRPILVNNLFTINSLMKKKDQLTYKKITFNQDNIIKYQNRLLSIEIPMPHEPIDPEAIFTNLSEAFEYAFPLE